MKILGISTSSKYPSAAVMLLEDGELYELSFRMEERTGISHSESLMGLIEGALAEAETPKEEIDRIAVDIGPGSFTGVRIGVSCANAMAAALGIPVLPVCSLNALCTEHGEGPCAAIIDCRNGNCYAAAFDGVDTIIGPSAAETRPILDSLPACCAIYGDVFANRSDARASDSDDHPNALKVVAAAVKWNVQPADQALPMYLRPSQAERMKQVNK